jgi:hypothetical protein
MATAFAASVHAASIIPISTPIPDSEVVQNFLGTGLDWVYAGPIAPNEFGPGNIENALYRASEGWRNATISEWALKPSYLDFAKGPGPISGSDHSNYKYTSEYWSTFSHVDIGDAAAGYITNGTNIGSLSSVYETWYVRTTPGSSIPSVPDGGSTVALLGLAISVVAGARRKFGV